MKKPLPLFLLTIIFFTFFGAAYLYLQQESILFQKTSLPDDHTFAYEEPFKELFLDTDTNARLNALYCPKFGRKTPRLQRVASACIIFGHAILSSSKPYNLRLHLPPRVDYKISI